MEDKIKLSDEQILEKQTQLERLEMQLELDEVTKKHLEKMLKNNFPMKQAQVGLNNHLKQMEIVKHNIKALKMQITSREI